MAYRELTQLAELGARRHRPPVVRGDPSFRRGNGRIGRAIAELALAQDMRTDQRLFSLSAALARDRAGYYAQLQSATGQAQLDAVWAGARAVKKIGI